MGLVTLEIKSHGARFLGDKESSLLSNYFA